MSSAVYEKIRNNPRFDELVGKRSRFAWSLSAIVLVLYFSFVMVVAFKPQLLATPLFSDTVTTVAWPIGAGLVLFFWILTGVYIRRANREFDEINSQLVKEALK
jgi:cation/acetate symporter